MARKSLPVGGMDFDEAIVDYFKKEHGVALGERTSEELKIQVGSVAVGGDAQISVQSMTTTLTSDVNATLQQIAELTAAGCDIVRVACPSQDDADALPAIAKKSVGRGCLNLHRSKCVDMIF